MRVLRYLDLLFSPPPQQLEWEAGAGTRRVPDFYQRRLLRVHATFRFFAFALGAGLLFSLNIKQVELNLALTLTIIVGLANAARVILPPFRLTRRSVVETSALGVELGLILALVLVSGGVESPFLIHTLSPVLTSALVLDWRSTTVLGVLAGGVVTAVHLLSPPIGGPLPGLVGDGVLTFVLLFLAATVLAVTLPFLLNINATRHRNEEAMQQERQRLRREVHDELSQVLAFLSLKTQRMEERGAVVRPEDINDISQSVRQAYLTVRDYLEEAALTAEALPLDRALSALIDTWGRESRIAVEFQVHGEDRNLPPTVRKHLLQIAREAMVNVRRHAGASRLTVALERGEAGTTLRIRDDGRGIPPGTPYGLGLTGMRQRAALIGASLDVRSASGEGTEVVVRVPPGSEKAR